MQPLAASVYPFAARAWLGCKVTCREIDADF
jgi:hypothetical protein